MKNDVFYRKNIFRSIDFWKSAIMTMEDDSFFELLRSVFGKIKTPFNKINLVNDLEKFLLREDINKTIAAYIDSNDAKIIAATALFGEPVPGKLESFFSGEFSCAQMQDIIVNLEERFILYRFKEKDISRIALNPVLEQALFPFTLDISVLFPSLKNAHNKADDTASMLNDRILAGLYSFSLQEKKIFKAEAYTPVSANKYSESGMVKHIIRKKTIETGKQIFPGMDLTLILGGLQALGLFYADKEQLCPDIERINDFGELSSRERMEYCAAGLVVYQGSEAQDSILAPLVRNKTRETAKFIHLFLDSLDEDLLYSEKTLKRLTEILDVDIDLRVNINILLDSLEKTGLLMAVPEENFHNTGDAGGALYSKKVTVRGAGNPAIAIESGFSILFYPEIEYTDAINLASFLSIKEAGTVIRFELQRDSAICSFDKNMNADEIINLLRRLANGRIDDTLIWTLKDWEKRYREVSLKKGVILTLAEDRRYLVKIRGIASMITETIAPGVYLLPESAMDNVADTLHDAGIDIISRPEPSSIKKAALMNSPSYKSIYNHFPSPAPQKTDGKKLPLSASKAAPCASPASSECQASSGRSRASSGSRAAEKRIASDKEVMPGAVLRKNFQGILEKMPLDKTARAELSARIDRRLVLCETQLKEADIRYEKLEARLLDYAGKQVIARQAVTQHAPLEIMWNKENRIFGIPKALEKEGDELILVILPDSEQKELRIPLGKVSLLRRIKKSIFT